MVKIQTAIKEHECDLCGKKIPKGDKYWRKIVKQNEYADIIQDRKEHTNCEVYKRGK